MHRLMNEIFDKIGTTHVLSRFRNQLDGELTSNAFKDDEVEKLLQEYLDLKDRARKVSDEFYEKLEGLEFGSVVSIDTVRAANKLEEIVQLMDRELAEKSEKLLRFLHPVLKSRKVWVQAGKYKYREDERGELEIEELR